MISEATSPLPLKITNGHVNKARGHRRDGHYCVVAQAIRCIAGVVGAYVGASFIRITYANGKTLRYVTPPELKEGLTYWDRTKDWKLPAGTYTLQPPKKHQTRKGIRKANAAHKVRLMRGEHVYEMSHRRKPTQNARHLEFLRRKAA